MMDEKNVKGGEPQWEDLGKGPSGGAVPQESVKEVSVKSKAEVKASASAVKPKAVKPKAVPKAKAPEGPKKKYTPPPTEEELAKGRITIMQKP